MDLMTKILFWSSSIWVPAEVIMGQNVKKQSCNSACSSLGILTPHKPEGKQCRKTDMQEKVTGLQNCEKTVEV